MVVCLNWKRFETPLIEGPQTNLVVPSLPTQGMQACEMMHERRDLTVFFRPKHHVPMVGHEAKTADPHGPRPQRLENVGYERLVIASVVKERSPVHAPIQDVKHHSTEKTTTRPRHARMYTICLGFRQAALPILPRFGARHRFSQ